jgi:hypothetical protein
MDDMTEEEALGTGAADHGMHPLANADESAIARPSLPFPQHAQQRGTITAQGRDQRVANVASLSVDMGSVPPRRDIETSRLGRCGG